MTARSPTTWSGTRRRRKTISSWCRRSSNSVAFFERSGCPVRVKGNASNKREAFSSEVDTGSRKENASNKARCGMCLLCDDEKAYQAYMNYLDAMERQGKAADPDKAIDAVLDQLEAQDRLQAGERAKKDDPANDKTLSPFFCSPVPPK